MKIAILLGIDKNSYSEFLINITSQNPGDNFIVFCLSIPDFQSPQVEYVIVKNFSFFTINGFIYKNLLQIQPHGLINLASNYPLFYKKPTIHTIFSLENIWYPELNQTKFLEKYKNAYMMKMNLKNASKIITISEKNKKDLNEKLNIEEEKIEVISGFFEIPRIVPQTKIDIKAKYVLKNNYILYDDTPGLAKNIKRFLQAVQEVGKSSPVTVLFLGNGLSNNIEIRHDIIQLGIEKKCIFVGNPAENEIESYYTQSSGVFSTRLYDHFPIGLEKALFFHTPIFVSRGVEIEKILSSDALYFNPLDIQSISQSIIFALEDVNHKNYSKILQKYTLANFTKHLSQSYKNIF